MRLVLASLLLITAWPSYGPPPIRFEQLNQQILSGTLTPKVAEQQFREVLLGLRTQCAAFKPYRTDQKDWAFPLSGYNIKQVGGNNGSGYLPNSYRYFDGNKHKGHPAHDIFIFDKNQDCLDDRTGKEVAVVSVTRGLVIATESHWDSNSMLRGGCFVWVYDFANELLIYYAHNSRVLVKTGDLVKPGQQIACVGRTGLNAAKKRSPTHLHIMALAVSKNAPIPYDLYPHFRLMFP